MIEKWSQMCDYFLQKKVKLLLTMYFPNDIMKKHCDYRQLNMVG